MPECIFCQIVAGRAPASIVYADDDVMAFMDLLPITPGHLLVIPKAHYRNLFDTPPAVAARVMRVAAQLALPLQTATGCQGLNLHVANEAVAGQEVWHLHLHLIPRHLGDGFGLRFPPGYGRRAEREQLDRIAASVREAWSHYSTPTSDTQETSS
jgi:histidine triad (HIT) family protein